MYICMYVCMYVCMYMCIYIYIYMYPLVDTRQAAWTNAASNQFRQISTDECSLNQFNMLKHVCNNFIVTHVIFNKFRFTYVIFTHFRFTHFILTHFIFTQGAAHAQGFRLNTSLPSLATWVLAAKDYTRSSVRRFPSFWTQPLENLSHYL